MISWFIREQNKENSQYMFYLSIYEIVNLTSITS